MMKRRSTSTIILSSSRCRSRVRQALYDEDLARARQQTPAEKLKIALELSEVCFKLRKAIQTAGKRHAKS
jgi:hypothetical protein